MYLQVLITTLTTQCHKPEDLNVTLQYHNFKGNVIMTLGFWVIAPCRFFCGYEHLKGMFAPILGTKWVNVRMVHPFIKEPFNWTWFCLFPSHNMHISRVHFCLCGSMSAAVSLLIQLCPELLLKKVNKLWKNPVSLILYYARRNELLSQ